MSVCYLLSMSVCVKITTIKEREIKALVLFIYTCNHSPKDTRLHQVFEYSNNVSFTCLFPYNQSKVILLLLYEPESLMCLR